MVTKTETWVRPRLSALTALRFLAALHVLLFHVAALRIHSGTGFYGVFAATGYMGVGLFFVLSGFILVYTYEGRSFRAREFWRARFARIYPAYAFALLLAAPAFFYVCLRTDAPSHAWFREHFVASVLLVPALLQAWVPRAALAWNGPAWSLSAEAFFYLVFPLLFRVLSSKTNRALFRVCVGAWLVGLAFPVAYLLLDPDANSAAVGDQQALFWFYAMKFNPLARLPEFVVGMAAGFLFVRKAVPRRWAAPLVIAGIVTVVLAIAIHTRIPEPVLHNALLAPVFAVTIYGLALDSKLSRALARPTLVLLGEASYSLYLLHVTLLGWFFLPTGTLRQTGSLELVVGILIPIVASVFVFRCIEEPARRRLRGRARNGAPMIEATHPGVERSEATS
jgi:peptidoglycan/LPS O-acetylase OafA/YrhL